MITKKLRLAAICFSLLLCVSAVGCGQKLPEGEHHHEYHLRDTVEGICSDKGYQLYACACGESFKSFMPSPHNYKTLTDTTGAYFKTVCTRCGDYSITHKQTYLFEIDFEGAEDVKAAAHKTNCACYRVGDPMELAEDGGSTVMKSVAGNYYILDKTDTMKTGKTFFISADIRYETRAHAAIFSILPKEKDQDFSYNAGLVFVEKDGKLSFVSRGDLRYQEDVYLSEEGYDNLTIKCDLYKGLYDVYLNQKLVRKNLSYVKTNDSVELVCARYFDVRYSDSDRPPVAYGDNVRMYVADIPEFEIDEERLTFPE